MNPDHSFYIDADEIVNLYNHGVLGFDPKELHEYMVKRCMEECEMPREKLDGYRIYYDHDKDEHRIGVYLKREGQRDLPGSEVQPMPRSSLSRMVQRRN